MKRWLVCGLFVGMIGITGATGTFAQERQTPGGYLFFSPRSRPAGAPAARFTDVPEAKVERAATAKCCGIAEDPAPPAMVALKPASAERAKSGRKVATVSAKVAPAVSTGIPPMPIVVDEPQPELKQVTWGTMYGLGYGYPTEGYSPGYPGPAFGRPTLYPLHGYRATYDWAGHQYSLHCYCAKGYCPDYCPGYRGACYTPGWNDNGTLIFERRCGRGSLLDCFWHMGGYERPCRTTDCPYVCQGAPSFQSYGFPHGAGGDPNYRRPRAEKVPTPQEKYPDPNPPNLESPPLEIPEDYRTVPKSAPSRKIAVPPAPAPADAPIPKPQP